MRRTAELQRELARGDGVLSLRREAQYFTQYANKNINIQTKSVFDC
jgi:hypothetical protein